MPDIKALREAVKNCDASAALNALPALLDELEAVRATIAKGLDYEHHSSCGHVWTMRHTACPECFAEMKAALAEMREWLLQDGELATITVAAVVAYMDAWASKEQL